MSLLVSSNVMPGEKPRMSDFCTSASDAGFRKLGWTATRTAAATTITPATTMAIFISPSQETSDHTTAGAFYQHRAAWFETSAIVGGSHHRKIAWSHIACHERENRP